MEAAIARLEALAALIIDQLDRLGIDADLEPSLGSIGDSGCIPQTGWAQGDCTGQDPEWQCEDEGVDTDTERDDSDMVPNYESHHSQTKPGYYGAY